MMKSLSVRFVEPSLRDSMKGVRNKVLVPAVINFKRIYKPRAVDICCMVMDEVSKK